MARKNRRSRRKRRDMMSCKMTRKDEDEIYPGRLVIAAEWRPKNQKIKKAGAQRTTG